MSAKRIVPRSADVMKNAEQKRRVTDAVDDERFLACIGRGFFVEVKSDQQIAARAHAFPSDEQQQEIIRQHQHQHGEHEEIQIAEETVIAAFVRHVAGGIDVNQKSDAGDDENHHRGKRVELKSPVGDEVREAAVEHVIRHGGKPFEQHIDRDAIILRAARAAARNSADGKNERDENAARRRAR